MKKRRRNLAIWLSAIVVIAGIIAAIFLARSRKITEAPLIIISGAVVEKAAEPAKEGPLANVQISASTYPQISASSGPQITHGSSDSSGYFTFSLPKGTKPHEEVTLQFRREHYQPLTMHVRAGDKLYLARMAPVPQHVAAPYQGPQITVSNISVRYSEKNTTLVNVGSEVKTFQAVNKGNVPCSGKPPCSPDGLWKGAVGSVTLDAGTGNVFHQARVSCIAGPCPFTAVRPVDFSHGGRVISVEALDWSDTATFLIEAEVFHPMVSNKVRRSYPVLFGRSLNFSVPSTAEGVCLEAELKGLSIVFPLGPDLLVRWATCTARVSPNETTVYLCQLKQGYKF